MSLNVIILAAGKGTRMRSRLPKVLHKIADKPLVEHVVNTAEKLNPSKIVVVYGHGGELVPTSLSHLNVSWVEQKEQLGTGHAVEQALPLCDDESNVLILYGDVPLTRLSTLKNLYQITSNTGNVGLLTAVLDNPTGYGRIVRDANHKVVRIVEQKDASEIELAIKETNTGIVSARKDDLKKWLSRLENKNAQGEFYLTDIIGLAVADKLEVITEQAEHLWEVAGINNKIQLADLERRYQLLIAEQLLTDGATLRDPARIDVRGNLMVGPDVEIDVNCVFEGEVSLGENVKVGPNCIIINSRIADGVTIKANSIVENAKIAARCEIGPFARIRPDTILDEEVKIGNFVEVKKTTIATGSKVNHLSYIGDTIMGSNVNIGAGTITCNYDGANKHLTEIGNNVFVGSDTQLVAPVKVGDGATIGAGSTITREVPANELTLSRSKQTVIVGWQRPVKKSR